MDAVERGGYGVKIQIEQDSSLASPEITIRCAAIDEDILRILSVLRIQDQKITGTKDGELFLLDARELYWFESVDKRCWAYARDAVYECPLRLYELEEKLACMDFLRISRAVVVNFRRVRSIRPDFGGRLMLTLENGERQCVSRQYAPAVREKLEGEGRKKK